MANNYTQTSFIFDAGTRENAAKVIAWIEGGTSDAYPSELRELMVDLYPEAFSEDDGSLDITIADASHSGQAHQVWIHIDESGDLEQLAVILAYAMEVMSEVPDGQGFQWAETCSSMRVNEFGGGACFIKRSGTEWLHTHYWLADQRLAKEAA